MTTTDPTLPVDDELIVSYDHPNDVTDQIDEPLDLDRIEARLDAATPGPWHVTVDPLGTHVENGDGAGRIVMRAGQDRDGMGHGDAEFIAAARQDVPALVAEVRRLHAELDAAPAAPCCTQRAGYDCDEHPGPSSVPPAGTEAERG